MKIIQIFQLKFFHCYSFYENSLGYVFLMGIFGLNLGLFGTVPFQKINSLSNTLKLVRIISIIIIVQIHCYFLLKKCENPLHCKSFLCSYVLSTKNNSVFAYVVGIYITS